MFGKFHGNLVYFMAIWNISFAAFGYIYFPRFGMLYQKIWQPGFALQWQKANLFKSNPILLFLPKQKKPGKAVFSTFSVMQLSDTSDFIELGQ
jgi:hypothetical protein